MRPCLEIFFSPPTKFPVYTIYRPSFFDNLSNNAGCFPPLCNAAVTILLKSNKFLLKVHCSKSINIKSLRLRVVYFLSLSGSVVSQKPLSSLRIYLVINLRGPKTKANTALYIKLSQFTQSMGFPEEKNCPYGSLLDLFLSTYPTL